MRITISLAPEEEAQLQQLAKERGQTAADLVQEQIRSLLTAPTFPQNDSDLPEIWRGLVGTLHSSHGSLSEETGKQFAEGMAEKRREGHL
jgi:hypothetical protein